MSEISRNLNALLTTPRAVAVGAVASGGAETVFYGSILDDALIIEDSEDGTSLPGPFESVVPYSEGDRVAFVLRGRRPLILSVEGGFGSSDAFAALESVADASMEAIFEQSQVLEAHGTIIGEIETDFTQIQSHLDTIVDPFIQDTDQKLIELPAIKQNALDAQADAVDATNIANLAKAAAEGMVTINSEEPAHGPGKIWIQTDENGGALTVLQSVNGQWATYPLMTGLLIVPGVDEDGNPRPTIIDQDGLVVGHISVGSIVGESIAVESIRAEHLVVASVTPDKLDENTQEVIDEAERIRRRVIIQDTGIVISESARTGEGTENLSGLSLKAKRLSFFLEGEPKAYIDSERDQMAVGNMLVENAIQIGEHQMKSLPGTDTTIMQWTGR